MGERAARGWERGRKGLDARTERGAREEEKGAGMEGRIAGGGMRGMGALGGAKWTHFFHVFCGGV